MFEFRQFLVMHTRSKVQRQTATVDPKNQDSRQEFCVVFPSFNDDVSLPTHINMSENRNMYLSFASLGVVNDLTCLINVFGQKNEQAQPSQRMCLKIQQAILF